MTKAVFTTSDSSIYDDLPERRYHFPGTYLNQARAALNDWILYYEPRRSAIGRQSYFAVAKVVEITKDPNRPDHYFAEVEGYLEFARIVRFEDRGIYLESALQKGDGSTNKGAFGRSVRTIPDSEFEAILKVGFHHDLEPWEQLDLSAAREPVATYEAHPIIEELVHRRFRDEAFRHNVRKAYNNTCAISGLRLINGGGRPEVQAAHIRPVAAEGPDSLRNGLALTATVHWLFDRGLISISDNHRVLISSQGVPDDLGKLIEPERPLILPNQQDSHPHPTFLAWHREKVFKR